MDHSRDKPMTVRGAIGGQIEYLKGMSRRNAWGIQASRFLRSKPCYFLSWLHLPRTTFTWDWLPCRVVGRDAVRVRTLTCKISVSRGVRVYWSLSLELRLFSRVVYFMALRSLRNQNATPHVDLTRRVTIHPFESKFHP